MPRTLQDTFRSVWERGVVAHDSARFGVSRVARRTRRVIPVSRSDIYTRPRRDAECMSYRRAFLERLTIVSSSSRYSAFSIFDTYLMGESSLWKKISSSLVKSIIYNNFCRDLAQIIKKLKRAKFGSCAIFFLIFVEVYLYMNIKILVQYFLYIPHVQTRFAFTPLIVRNN